jgi:hypothetical protein
VTAQIPDTLIFKGREFSLTAVDGSGLFDPADHGIEPEALHTACYHGFVVTYAVRDDRLRVASLVLGSQEQPIPLGGVVATPGSYKPEWVYRDLDLPVEFTGRVLIGDGEIDDRPYLHMGFWPAWMYADVHELLFERGALIESADRTGELAAARKRLGKAGARPAPGQSTIDWIGDAFSLTFAYSWPGSGPDGGDRS